MNAIAYCRISRDLDGSESCEQQEAAIREWAADQPIVVASVHVDRGFSGADRNRPALWEAIASLGKGDFLVATKPDRLARDMSITLVIEEKVKARGATITTLSAGEQENTPEGKLTRRIFAAFAEFEKDMIGVRTSAAMLAHQRNGRAMSARPPLGKKRVGDALVDDPEEKQAMKYIRERGPSAMSHADIARSLNNCGLYKRVWSARTVGRVLAKGTP